MSDPDLERNFTYHRPTGDQPERYTKLRAKAKEFAEMIVEHVPASRERSLALTKIEESVMWANAGIARNEADPVVKASDPSDPSAP